MSSVNKVFLLGNLGKNPEGKRLENGNFVCTFTLATSKTYKDKAGEKQTQTTWHNIVAWGSTAEVAVKYLEKGRRVHVEGEIQNRDYTDQQGTKRYISEIVVSSLTLLDSPDKSSRPSPPQEQSSAAYQPTNQQSNDNPISNPDDDDLPF